VLNENYDTGGQGVAYNVTSTNGTANTYRTGGVDLEAATAPATGNDLGWSTAGQWFRYTVNASTAGTYTVSFLVASPAAITDGFHLSNSSGTNLTGSVNVPATGGYQTWVTVTASVTLPAGTQTLTLNDDAAGWNIDSMVFATGGGGCTTKPSVPTGLASSGTTSSSTNLSWATDSAPANCSISSYTVLKNGASIGTATGTSFAVSGLSASTNYTFTVEATDAAGTSAASSAVSVTTSASGGSGPIIATQPASQTVSIGKTATFTVIVSGTGPFTYQWQKIAASTSTAVPISGATSSSYNTPTTSAPDNGAAFNVVVKNAGGSTTSANAVLTVNSFPAYTLYPGFIGTDLNNNTHGAWADNQIYIEVLGNNVTTNALAWVNYDGTVNAASIADNTASNAVTGPDGKTYPHYFFTLAQSNNFLKLPPLNAARIFVSLGSPVYIPIMAGNPLGYAGPNPLNPTDPNLNVYYDWYEFDWGGSTDAMFINTTQVDMFGLPLTLDLWGTGETFHQQTGITESVAAIDQEFTNETPATFQAGQSPISPLRIWAPAHMTFQTGGANGNYFQSYVNSVWAEYATTPLTVMMDNNSHEYTGTTSGTTFNFTEVNLNNGAYGGPGTYTINEPTTQDILLCDGSMATGTGVTAALEAQFCAAFNRHVMDNYANWTNEPSYYQTAPTNYFSAFMHKHSIAGLSYGFAYDDVDNWSSSIVGAVPEHMAFGISW
jgi:hypothetical protein